VPQLQRISPELVRAHGCATMLALRGVPRVPRAGKYGVFGKSDRNLAGGLPAVTGNLGPILSRVPAVRQEKIEEGSWRRRRFSIIIAWVSCRS